MRGEREKQIFRKTQGARISRWIRDSEAGWLFYGPDGKAYHILSDEARKLEAEGNAMVERVLALGFVPMPRSGAMVIAVIGTPVALAFALAFLAPAKLTMTVVLVVMALAFGPVLVLNIANDVVYELSLRRWRQDVAARLEGGQRGGVPQPIADKHRRYNLFLVVCLAATLAAAVTIVTLWTGGASDGFILIVLGFLILAMGSDWASRRVDATHRRRKWFD
jgi:hypothetical protein